jgi:hypothetical protein
MSALAALVSGLLALAGTSPISDVRGVVEDVADVLFPDRTATPARLERQLIDRPLRRHPGDLRWDGPPRPGVAWGNERLVTWFDGRLLVYDTRNWNVVIGVEMLQPAAIAADGRDRVFWAYGFRGGISLWGLARTGSRPVKIAQLALLGADIRSCYLRTVATPSVTDVWIASEHGPPARLRILHGPVPVLLTAEQLQADGTRRPCPDRRQQSWGALGGIVASARRVTVAVTPHRGLRSYQAGRLPALRHFAEPVADLVPGTDDEHVWALLPDWLLELDVGRRRVRIVRGLPIEAHGQPIRLAVRGRSIAVLATNDLRVLDHSGRLRFREAVHALQEDLALSPDGTHVALTTTQGLTVWSVRDGRQVFALRKQAPR